MNVALTGSNGFLGFHTRAAVHSLGGTTKGIEVGANHKIDRTVRVLEGSELLVHVAGVNRGSDDEVRSGNVEFARQLADSLLKTSSPPEKVVYANSVQAGNGTIYGQAKAEAGEILASAAGSIGAEYSDVLLPNLFGEYGRPFYNSVVATFCHMLHNGQAPEVKEDRELLLLHAQTAAEVLVGAATPDALEHAVTRRSVSSVLEQLREISQFYRNGDIPDIGSAFNLNLFNTYRSFRVGQELPFVLDRRADARGSFFEVCRSRGGDGQTSFSTTVPGVTRGEHFHRRKVERFVVLSGKAEIAMRRLFSDEVLRFTVDGSNPVAIDMPTLWTHNITNTGDSDLYTMFWTNDIFDPSNPDTFAEKVCIEL